MSAHRQGGSVVPVALFDLDNTLFDRSATYRTWASGFADTHRLGPDEIEWLCDVDDDGFADRTDVWTQAKQRFALADPVDKLVRTYRAGYFGSMTPDPGVCSALAVLRAEGWRIAIVTNAAPEPQTEKAHRLGLLALTDGFCASGELGIEKPDRRIFEEVIRRCTDDDAVLEPRWMVGDSPSADIAGARALGIPTIWIDRGRTWDAADGPPPDLTVRSVIEAIEAVRLSRR